MYSREELERFQRQIEAERQRELSYWKGELKSQEDFLRDLSNWRGWCLEQGFPTTVFDVQIATWRENRQRTQANIDALEELGENLPS